MSNAGEASATTSQNIFRAAQTQMGKWYRSGYAGPTYYDCSGLVMWAAWHAAHLSIPHWTHQQYESRHVHNVTGFYNTWNDNRTGVSNIGKALRAGDLIYFFTRPGTAPEHVGFYYYRTSYETLILNARHPGSQVRYDSVESFAHSYPFVRGARIW